MSDCLIYHNPRCSKSRQTLALLEERGMVPEVIRYLETPPTVRTLTEVLDALGLSPWALLRRQEPCFKALGLTPESPDHECIAAMIANPVLIERPIVVREGKAAIGRPPEAVLSLFE